MRMTSPLPIRPLRPLQGLIISTLWGALLSLSMGCGASAYTPPPEGASSPSSPALAPEASGPLGALLVTARSAEAQFEEKRGDGQALKAVATLALFTAQVVGEPEATALAQRTERAVRGRLKKDRAPSTLISRLARRFAMVPAEITADLPIRVEAFLGGAGALRAGIETARGVIFLRYADAPLSNHAHLSALCASALALGGELEGVVIGNVSTLETFDLPAFTARCASINARWVRPAVELIEGGQVRFISRGLSQFGRPDLESAPMSKDRAPKIFKRFQEDIELLRTGPHRAVGERLGEHTLNTCQRPSHHFELECVGVSY
jgi:hypothetical protein